MNTLVLMYGNGELIDYIDIFRILCIIGLLNDEVWKGLEMNTIHYGKRQELQTGRFVIPFSCSDLVGVRTELRPSERSDAENKVLGTVSDRITLALQNRGYELEYVNFRNMAVTVFKTEV